MTRDEHPRLAWLIDNLVVCYTALAVTVLLVIALVQVAT